LACLQIYGGLEPEDFDTQQANKEMADTKTSIEKEIQL
jgi:hypothetical protein